MPDTPRDTKGAQCDIENIGQRFPQADRLKKTSQFKAVYDQRHRASDHLLIVYASPNNRKTSRLGLSVSRKFGHAVLRNRWKRMVREAFRTNRAKLPCGFDFVVIPVPGTTTLEFNALCRSLCSRARHAAKLCSPPELP